MGDLPEFKKPPVVETAHGVEFLPIEGFGSSHYYRFARSLEPDYPIANIQDSLIMSSIERFGQDAFQPPKPELIDAATMMRWWYESADHQWLLQLQSNRFVQNWRKLGPEHSYPRYPETKRMFARNWQRFLDFLGAEKLKAPVVTQVQVDYVNHLEQGEGWTNLDELSEVTPVLRPVSANRFLPSPEVVLLNLRFVIPPERGRLHVSLQPAIRQRDHAQILQLQLLARGQPAGQGIDDLLSFLDVGHEWIVRGFAELTTESVQKLWERVK